MINIYSVDFEGKETKVSFKKEGVKRPSSIKQAIKLVKKWVKKTNKNPELDNITKNNFNIKSE